MAEFQKSVLMGVIGSPHGTGGEVYVRSFTGDPAALGNYGLLYDRSGKNYLVKSVRQQKGRIIACFEGIDSRALAETLKGTELFIDRSCLPDNLEEDEFYQHDLLGFSVIDPDGRDCGIIKAFFNFGGGDLVEISGKGKKKWLVPFSKAVVSHVDMVVRQVVVDSAAAGIVVDSDYPVQRG